ncbi:MAG: SusC/RagA family TonB-linked outer membrane protein [Muribaculaceae bacterium]|nr:SusC/RagA family TonB-linked outer membrane protein [Muribaculaceae bacterium]
MKNHHPWRQLLAAALLATGLPLTAQRSAPTDTLAHVLSPTVVTADQVSQQQVTNPLEAINGRVAGVTIQKSNNGAAAMSAVRVRGTTSITGGNDPLIIIDGVFGDLSTLSSIYPSDIESFTVLKDASETAQYGSRGASGVIEVVTKKGAADRATVTYNGSVGVTHVIRNLKMLDADSYRKAVSSQGGMLIDKGYSTNWQKAIQQTAFLQDHHIAFMGGGDRSGYRVSLGFMDHDGVILHDKLRNLTSNMNMHQRMFGDLLAIEVGMFGNVQNQQTAVYDVQKTFYSAQAWNPTFGTLRNSGGGWDGFTYANQINHPMALMDNRTRDKTTHLSTHAKLTFNLTQDWTLSIFGAYSHNEVEVSQFLPTSIWSGGKGYRSSAKTESLLGNATVTWDKTWGMHHVNVRGLAEVERDTHTGFYTTTTGYSNNDIGIDAIQAGAVTIWDGTGSYRNAPSLASFLARINYDFGNRYSLTVAARADGSSKFSKGNKWGFFPSISASWNLGNETFLQGVTWLDDLKWNIGYGLAGNLGGVDSYMAQNLLTPAGIAAMGESLAVTLDQLVNANPDLKWEVKRSFNTGLSAAFLGNRIIAALDFYTSKTTDMLYLYNVGVPPFSYNKLLDNLGSMRNSGVELALGLTPLTTRDMELNVNANVAYQYNKLLSLSGYYKDYWLEAPGEVDLVNLNGAGFHGGNNHIVYQMVGQPLGVFYLPHCTGLKSDGQGGYVYDIADLDGSGDISIANGKDRRVCGQAMPKVLLGSNINYRFKQWDVTLQINGAFGHKIYNGTALTYMNMNSLPGYNVLADAPERNIKDQTATDYWLERGDYINFDYLTVGWNVPLGAKAQRTISRLRLSLTIGDLATITGYSGLTPMINSSSAGGTLGVDDKNVYPVTRSYYLGVNITF